MAMGTVIIGIDHGNGNMKTAHTVFPCGYKMQETEPSAMFAKDIISYNGAYYSLTPNRFSYQVDKTTDERCYILTLFAVAKELAARRLSEVADADVVLAVGLPPAHFEKQHSRFKRYFEEKSAEGMNFSYNRTLFRLRIVGVAVYPQDYAAAVVYRDDIGRDDDR